MYRTRICDKCDNNKFLIIPDGISFKVQCSECNTIRETFQLDGKMIVPSCPKCKGELFKFREKEKENSIEIDFICSQCGEKASYIYIDDEGNKVNLEERTFLDMKKFLESMNDRLYNIDFSVNVIKNLLEDEFILNEKLNNIFNNINNELNSIKSEAEIIDMRIKKFNK
ncbi:hypothetical protein SAMN05428976_103254 [Clostridium sp. USBA 49]|jgi:uncharacterized protein YbaR (Trm112 family)|uniref:hypothetical protein n=1 Tax=Clostridium TaxID=1485 RepID=UPI000999F52E|nr:MULTISPECIES: hypothetical protein [Clostridium]SKA79277.1 hypothetical protein SAMN05428976_103254 [Clostridium sp. USBA 49]